MAILEKGYYINRKSKQIFDYEGSKSQLKVEKKINMRLL